MMNEDEWECAAVAVPLVDWECKLARLATAGDEAPEMPDAASPSPPVVNPDGGPLGCPWACPRRAPICPDRLAPPRPPMKPYRPRLLTSRVVICFAICQNWETRRMLVHVSWSVAHSVTASKNVSCAVRRQSSLESTHEGETCGSAAVPVGGVPVAGVPGVIFAATAS